MLGLHNVRLDDVGGLRHLIYPSPDSLDLPLFLNQVICSNVL